MRTRLRKWRRIIWASHDPSRQSPLPHLSRLHSWDRGDQEARVSQAKIAKLRRFLRFHCARLFIGNPSYFFASLHDGAQAFRRDFSRTWSDRWKAGERAEAERRLYGQQP